MTDHEPRLDALDRRAANAVAELDRALPSDLSADSDWLHTPDLDAAPSRRGLTPLLLVAAVAVVAILGLGLAISRLDGGDDQSTIAGEVDADETVPPGEFVRLAIPDPAAHGLELTAAYDGIDAANPSGPDPMTVQGPVAAGDPWDAAVEVTTVPQDDEIWLYGEVVDLGGVDGSLLVDLRTSLRWGDSSGSEHLLSSTWLDPAELTTVAREAVAAGWTGDGPLPGHQILHRPVPTDFTSLSYVPSDDEVRIAAVGYRGDDFDFVVGTTPGGEAAFRYAQMVFGDPQAVEVRGHDAVLLQNSYTTLSTILWRENSETLVRAETYNDPAEVIDTLDALQLVDSPQFSPLTESHPVTDERRLLVVPEEEFERFGDPQHNPPDELLAELTSIRQGLEAYALLGRYDRPPTQLTFTVDHSDGTGAGSAAPANDLSRPVLQRGEDGTRTVYSGIVPGNVESIEVENADRVQISDIEQTGVIGTEANLFIAWSPVDVSGSSTILRITLTDGRVIRYAV